MNLWLYKVEKTFYFVIDYYLKDSAFTTVKRDAMFKTRYVRERYNLSIEGIRKGCLSRKKWYIKVGPRGGASPCKHLLSTPSPPPPPGTIQRLNN